MDDRACLRNRILQTILPAILNVVDTCLLPDLENTKDPWSSFEVSASQMPLLLKQKIKNLIYDDMLRINNIMAKSFFQKNDNTQNGCLGNTNSTNLASSFLFKPSKTHYTNPKQKKTNLKMKQHMSSFKKDITKIMMLEDEIIAPKKKKTLQGFQSMEKSESDGSTKGSSNSYSSNSG